MSFIQMDSRGDEAYTGFDVALLILGELEPGVDFLRRGAMEDGVVLVGFRAVAHGCG